MRVMSRREHPKTLRRPLQHIYPLEVRCEPTDDETHSAEDVVCNGSDNPSLTPMGIAEPTISSTVCRRPTRMAAIQARDRILGCAIEDARD